MHKNSHKIALFLIFFTGSVSVNASEPQQQSSEGGLSGSLAVLSQYIYRGGIENDQPTLQAGLEYEHTSGLYAGYWASTLNYDAADVSKDHGVEHDFYMGYAGTLSPDFSYRSHIVTYLYNDGGSVYSEDRTERRSTTGAEFVNSLSYKDFDVGVTVALVDVSYANAGDTYLSLAHHYALPQHFQFNSSIGASIYRQHDDAILTTEKNFTINEVRLGLSRPFAETGIEMSADYIYGVHNRMGEDLEDHLVLGLTYNF